MALTRKNFLQRTSDGKYLRPDGKWANGVAGARSESTRGSLGAVAVSKPESFQRVTKQYTKS